MILTNKYLKPLLLIVVLIPILLLSGCGEKEPSEEKEAEKPGGEKKGEEVPEQLKDIENSIEKIIMSLKGPTVAEQEDEIESDDIKGQMQEDENKRIDHGGKQEQNEGQNQQENGQGGQNSEQKGQNGNQEEGEDKDKKQNEQQQDEQKTSEYEKNMEKDIWKEIDKMINEMHYKWNSYLPMAVNASADRKLIDNFSTALNSLTDTIIGKNKTNTLLACSYLYAYVPDFFSLYKSKISPEVKRVRHYVRNASLNAITGNWDQSKSDMENLKASWALFKNSIDENSKESANKLDLSIYELDRVIAAKNQSLSDIKGRITLSNVKELEKSMEEEPGQEVYLPKMTH